MSSTRIWVHDRVSVGDNVKFGACVMVTDTDSHPVDYMARRSSNEETKSKPVTIEDDVWIGAHSIILKSVNSDFVLLGVYTHRTEMSDIIRKEEKRWLIIKC